MNSAIRDLLCRDDDQEVQVLYVHLKNGKTLVFLGSPLSEEDFEKLDDITFGECIPPTFLNMIRMAGTGIPVQ